MPETISRRKMLEAMGLSLAAVGLSGCGGEKDPGKTKGKAEGGNLPERPNILW